MRDKAPDWFEDAVTQAPHWEPPPGFAVHVAAAARQEHTTPEPRVRRERLLFGYWWRASVAGAIEVRIQNSFWVVRQYLSVVSR
jgi:hypothetical protein